MAIRRTGGYEVISTIKVYYNRIQHAGVSIKVMLNLLESCVNYIQRRYFYIGLEYATLSNDDGMANFLYI